MQSLHAPIYFLGSGFSLEGIPDHIVEQAEAPLQGLQLVQRVLWLLHPGTNAAKLFLVAYGSVNYWQIDF